jgi:hypothetical protein
LNGFEERPRMLERLFGAPIGSSESARMQLSPDLHEIVVGLMCPLHIIPRDPILYAARSRAEFDRVKGIFHLEKCKIDVRLF